VRTVDTVKEVLNVRNLFMDKPVSIYETQVKEKQVHVPQVLVQEKVTEVPLVQTVEAERQRLQPLIQNVVKEVPKVQMAYKQKIVEVGSRLIHEAHGFSLAASASTCPSATVCQASCRTGPVEKGLPMEKGFASTPSRARSLSPMAARASSISPRLQCNERTTANSPFPGPRTSEAQRLVRGNHLPHRTNMYA